MANALKTFLDRRRLRKTTANARKHVRGLLALDDDIFDEKTKKELRDIESGLGDLDPKTADAEGKLEKLVRRFNAAVPKKSFALVREWMEILVVALSVAFGVRALYLQPFKIPTSSMQPTLFGIHYVVKDAVPNLWLPPLNFALFSSQRATTTIREAGELEEMRTFNRYILFPYTTFRVGDSYYTLPGTRDKVMEYALKGRDHFTAGEVLCDGWLTLGDHLFVDRFSYHFSGPRRGDIAVFNTEGLRNHLNDEPLVARGYYYVKRLVGMPGDTLKILKDTARGGAFKDVSEPPQPRFKLYIKPKGETDFRPVDAFEAAAFKRVYSDKGGYHGHLSLAKDDELLLLDENRQVQKEVVIPEDCYFMMGDNSAHSSDSRFWGFVPRRNIVGKAAFVFWPFSRRWGLTDRVGPLDVETTFAPRMEIPAMERQ